jgi:hypothetical protein
MTTDEKGVIAVEKTILRAIEKGFKVSKPIIESRYDLIIDDGIKLHKVQVKYGDGICTHTKGAVSVNLRSWNNGTRKKIKSKVYTSTEIDAVITYIPKIDKVLWFGPEKFHGKAGLHIRIDPPKIKNTKNATLAKDYIW